ncbi:hypothetical protein [Chryseobacterium indologenes]|uniref:hypothetical protein n=1 Tax=Chryseobacterium indologenes TaxID=253 RepID=UPI001BCB305E|nr:hypothetical protein [Chryseobacterium indologenes]
MRKILLSLFLISGFCLSNAQNWEPASQKVSEIRREVKNLKGKADYKIYSAGRKWTARESILLRSSKECMSSP